MGFWIPAFAGMTVMQRSPSARTRGDLHETATGGETAKGYGYTWMWFPTSCRSYNHGMWVRFGGRGGRRPRVTEDGKGSRIREDKRGCG